MALYFPPLFCGVGTTLSARKDFEVEWQNEEGATITAGTNCVVDAIIGYGFNVRVDGKHQVFRIKNSSMPAYFDLIKKVAPVYTVDVDKFTQNEEKIATLQRDFIIEQAVEIPVGSQFLYVSECNERGVFYELFAILNKRKVLSMKEVEFEHYFLTNPLID